MYKAVIVAVASFVLGCCAVQAQTFDADEVQSKRIVTPSVLISSTINAYNALEETTSERLTIVTDAQKRVNDREAYESIDTTFQQYCFDCDQIIMQMLEAWESLDNQALQSMEASVAIANNSYVSDYCDNFIEATISSWNATYAFP